MAAPIRDEDFNRIERWATEIVQAVIKSPGEHDATLRVMRLLSDIQTQVAQQTIDEIGKRLHAVPTTSTPTRRTP
jgi:hypothetical protein